MGVGGTPYGILGGRPDSSPTAAPYHGAMLPTHH